MKHSLKWIIAGFLLLSLASPLFWYYLVKKFLLSDEMVIFWLSVQSIFMLAGIGLVVLLYVGVSGNRCEPKLIPEGEQLRAKFRPLSNGPIGIDDSSISSLVRFRNRFIAVVLLVILILVFKHKL